MNFQPPKPERRRMYIDGISVVKSSSAPLQPLHSRIITISTREPVLAHRSIPLTDRNRLGLPTATRSVSSLAKMRKITLAAGPAATSLGQGITHHTLKITGEITGRARVWATAAMSKNWQAFMPARYKKYTATKGVQANRTFKNHGATAMVAVLAVLGLGLWPQGGTAPQAGVADATGASIVAPASAFSSATSTTQKGTKTAAATASLVVSAKTASPTEGALLQASAAIKQEALPVGNSRTTGTTPSQAAESAPAASTTSPSPNNEATPVTTTPPAAEPGADGSEDTPGSTGGDDGATPVTPEPPTPPTETPAPQPPLVSLAVGGASASIDTVAIAGGLTVGGSGALGLG